MARRKGLLTAGWDIGVGAVFQGADVMFPLVSGPAWIFLGIGVMVVSTLVAYVDEIDAWWTKRHDGSARPRTVARDGALSAEEVKRLRRVSDSILIQVDREYQLTQAEHLALCAMVEVAKGIFERHDIPHPDVPWESWDGGNFSLWFRKISSVIAHAEDIPSARRAVQDSDSSCSS